MRYAAEVLASLTEIREFHRSRFANGHSHITIRRILLELWAMFLAACIVGFLGPFGTYDRDHFADRAGNWWVLLMGAYLLIRPAMVVLARLALSARLPVEAVTFWGAALCSVPLAIVWRAVGRNVFSELDGYSGLLPFSLLCSLLVVGVARWSVAAEARLQRHADQPPPPAIPIADTRVMHPHDPQPEPVKATAPLLLQRLPAGFAGPVIALQSEDHYVRVHGPGDSALVLMRLRDAIAEMSGVPGVQVHRSWWIPLEAIAGAELNGRNWVVRLQNGLTAPVARDSTGRLENLGIAPGIAARAR